MAKTKINKTIVDWIDVKNKCRTTVNKGKSEIEATSKFKKQLLISEHSPIRLIKVNWIWEGIKSWVSVHFARHWNGWEKWISTQRSDRTGVDRNKSTQDTPVNMEIEANAQALINVSKVRLCYQASKETREQMEDLKYTLHNGDTEELSEVLVPNCIYRCGCPEFQSCGVWEKFVKENHAGKLLNIEKRYEVYNNWFYERKDKDE